MLLQKRPPSFEVAPPRSNEPTVSNHFESHMHFVAFTHQTCSGAMKIRFYLKHCLSGGDV
ncbi:uncharacterized protein EI90DRAFT_271835 [Cantharellus anzutake]|uniref:uncharacterized protein n=1 Tax=Cantharellus anzutake TaxID=1750568 RepID=UPI001907B8F6|nr:uncharacterized protein EI90DRAFT_271835 [Cantharellus anzutake]KAF8335890.1 hypothetical protein EI90DRAFT_271835 [Cantharellus anzutake]